MSFLFKIENNRVQPHPETLLIHPFSEIWERDISEGKVNAREDLTYVEFMTSQKKSNPYSGYDDSIKEDKIKKDIITRKDWVADSLIFAAMDKIQVFQTENSITYTYYVAARTAAEKIKSFFLQFDINERNERTGNPVYKPRDITSAVNDTSNSLTNLANLREKVDQELFESTKIMGQKEVSVFASPSKDLEELL